MRCIVGVALDEDCIYVHLWAFVMHTYITKGGQWKMKASRLKVPAMEVGSPWGDGEGGGRCLEWVGRGGERWTLPGVVGQGGGGGGGGGGGASQPARPSAWIRHTKKSI